MPPPSTRAALRYLGAPRALLVIASMVTIAASPLVWLSTPLGGLAITDSGPLVENASHLALCAGLIAVLGARWRDVRVVLAHILILALPAVLLPIYHLGWALANLPGLGEAWLPGPGLVLVLLSGIVATYAASRLVASGPTQETT